MATVVDWANVILQYRRQGNKFTPQQEKAFFAASKAMREGGDLRAVMTAFTSEWRFLPPVEQPKPLNYLLLTVGKPGNNGLIGFVLAGFLDDDPAKNWVVYSGARGAQVIDKPELDWAGSNRPIPHGLYKLGPVERSPSGNWGPGLGPLWVDLIPVLPKNKRSSIGLHQDANFRTAPGSAGCVVHPDLTVITDICEWVTANQVEYLLVNYGYDLTKEREFLLGARPSSAPPTLDGNAYQLTPRRRAILDVIAWAEGTSGADGYRTMFTHKLFDGYADHPRQMQTSGKFKSDAAGRYQFLSTTWDEVKRAMNLPDFSPTSQDQAALWLIDAKRGVLDEIDRGDLKAALEKLSWEWASLPPGRYGQPQKKFSDLQKLFGQKVKEYS